MQFPKLYTEFAKYYDRLEKQYRDYDLESKWLQEIFRKRGLTEIVDISCGTGNHISLLAENPGLKIQAIDASREMIPIAKEKTGSRVSFLVADFLHSPYRANSFDAALCMYWSVAGLDEEQVRKLFRETNSILRMGGVLILDLENAEGIKENLINTPFIDAYFEDEKEGVALVRTNFSTKKSRDVVDWTAYYMIEKGGISEMETDRMDLRFYSKKQVETQLNKEGFGTVEVLSGPYKTLEEHSPSLYFVAEKVASVSSSSFD
jgi:ubiquinone/menaquinone biosynthesis C-methylase UbiE